jgi:hypothetical protein
MNNEPVAWIKKGTLTYLGNYNYASIAIQVQKSNSVGFDIPLYTRPVKELTDEEINELWLVTCSKAGEVEDMQLHFANAILRKAQE